MLGISHALSYLVLTVTHKVDVIIPFSHRMLEIQINEKFTQLASGKLGPCLFDIKICILNYYISIV